MDIIHQCLSLVPVPYLSSAFAAFRFIWSSVQQAQASKQQLAALAQSIAQLLQALDREYRARRLQEIGTSSPLAYLSMLLDEISAFIQKEEKDGFLKLLFTKDQRIVQIEGFHRRISASVESFQISALLNIHAWQTRNDAARAADQRLLHERLLHLETNQLRLVEALNMHQSDVMAMMVSLRRRLDDRSDGDQEQRFFSHALRYLTTSSGRQVEIKKWMITSYEVEFGPQIGSGGLCVLDQSFPALVFRSMHNSGQVFVGTWNKAQVAIKVLKTEAGTTPSLAIIRREIETWSMLRHTHILQFLGANELDDKPFIVMPFLKNGNARDYVRCHLGCNRIRILHHISLGLVYLHSQKVVHGDLKALNVLIDDSGKAVLCDFGLSRLKADTTSRISTIDGRGIVGSRNWMAPEQLLGGLPKKPCDIYAFGMTLYEIFVNEIPLGHVNYADFIDFVVQRDIRPERPDDDDAPQLSDAVWALAEKCWVGDAKHRPTAGAVCDILSHLLGNISQPITNPALSQLTANLSLLHSTAQASSSPPMPPLPDLTMQGHTGKVWCAAFSTDGKYIASGSNDCTVVVWDAQTGDLTLGPLKRHTGLVSCVAFSPSGRRIASGSADGAILVWDAVTGQVVAGPFKRHSRMIQSVCFSPDGNKVASGSSDKTVGVWDVQLGVDVVGPLTGHTKNVTSVVFSGDGKRIASGSEDKTVKVWDVKAGRLVEHLGGQIEGIIFVAFSPDGKMIVSLSHLGNICVWDTDTGTLASGPSMRHAEGTLTVAFSPSSKCCAVSPNGRWVAGFLGKSVHIWDSQTGLFEATFSDHTKAVYSVSFSADSRRVLSASFDKTIRVRTLNL